MKVSIWILSDISYKQHKKDSHNSYNNIHAGSSIKDVRTKWIKSIISNEGKSIKYAMNMILQGE